MEIKKVLWFTSGSDVVGIALVDNGREKRAYIKKVSGYNQEEDSVSIIENGAKLNLSEAEDIVEHLKDQS